MTLYQLELLSPLGVWTPCGPPARSMTAAYLFGLRLYPNHDLRVMPVEEGEFASGSHHFVKLGGKWRRVGVDITEEEVRQHPECIEAQRMHLESAAQALALFVNRKLGVSYLATDELED
jgi:hypothetical protein